MTNIKKYRTCTMTMGLTKGALLGILITGLMACQKSPKQYDTTPHTSPSGLEAGKTPNLPYQPTKPGGGVDKDYDPVWVKIENRSQEEIDAIINENSLQPIVYGKSAGGITLDTTYEESFKILGPKSFGPDLDDNGRTGYKEGMHVFWRQDEPYVPESILILPSYLGEIQLPLPFDNLRMGDSLGEYFKDDDPDGKELIKKLFNVFEEKDNDFDCLSRKLCQLDTSNANYLAFVLPKLQLLIARENRVLFIALVKKDISPGKLANDFDVMNGQFVLADTEGVPTGETISLGSTWKELREKSGVKTYTTLTPQDFIKHVSGIGIGINRSKGGRLYTQPEDDEIFSGLTLYGQYNHKIKVGNEFLQIKKVTDKEVELLTSVNASSVELENNLLQMANGEELEEAKKSDAEKFESGEAVDLKVDMSFLKDNVALQTSLVKKLSTYFQSMLEKEAQNSGREAEFMVDTKISGYHAYKGDREFAFSSTIFDMSSGVGKIISMDIDKDEGKMSFSVSQIFNPVAKKTLVHSNENWEAGSSNFMGFKLGELVTTYNNDFPLQEAQYMINENEFQMVDWLEEAASDLIFEEKGKFIETRMSHELLKNLSGVNLRVKPLRVKDGVKTYLVIGIGSGRFNSTITNLCGLTSFKAEMGMSGDAFVQDFKNALASESNECPYYIPNNPNDDEVLNSLYLPTQKLKLEFSDNQLSAVVIYMSEDQITKTIEALIKKEKEALEAKNLSEGGQE